MRIRIVGGGIAALTLAALLRQRGLRPQIVERIHGYGGSVLGGLVCMAALSRPRAYMLRHLKLA